MLKGLLQEFSTTGCSKKTAKAQGVSPGIEGSQRLARIDLSRLLEYEEYFKASAEKYIVPAALLAAICSRETRGRNVIGDHSFGIGLMQIDRRYHTFNQQALLVPSANIDMGASILTQYWKKLRSRHDLAGWTVAETLRGAVCAYNSGPGNVHTWKNLDVGTTGDDYSADVWERARALISYF